VTHIHISAPWHGTQLEGRLLLAKASAKCRSERESDNATLGVIRKARDLWSAPVKMLDKTEQRPLSAQAIVDTVERVVARFMLTHPEATGHVPQAV